VTQILASFTLLGAPKLALTIVGLLFTSLALGRMLADFLFREAGP